MESLSNNKKQSTSALLPFSKGEGQEMMSHNSSSPSWLLLLFLFLSSSISAQHVFNKVYSLNSKSTVITDITSLGNNGSFLAFADVIDSSSGQREVKIIRYNAAGDIQMEQILRHPEHPTKRIYTGVYNEACRIHDNLYALVVTRYVGLHQWGSSLITIDSNGILQNIQDILEPLPGAADTFSFLTSVSYDEMGHLILAGHNGSELAGKPMNFQLLMKFDTMLNLIWKKTLRPTGALYNISAYELVLRNNSYQLYGGGQQNYLPWSDTNFKTQSLILSTDTGGVVQWQYVSPVKWMYDCEATVSSGIPTADGGYLYLTTGNVYDFYPTAPATAPMGKFKLIKLDATRNRIWEKEIEKFNHSFGSRNERMMELGDSSIVIVHSYSTDSINDEGHYYRDYLFSRYSADGSLMYQRKLTPPQDAGDTSRIHFGWSILDIYRMPDKSFLLGGVYRNGTYGSIGYNTEKGWLIKLDSNGCLGPDDPQCDKTSITQLNHRTDSKLKVYPNPSNGKISILYNFTPQESIEAIVYDMFGRSIHKELLIFSNKETSLNLCIPNGSYILELKDEEGNVQRERIVIK